MASRDQTLDVAGAIPGAAGPAGWWHRLGLRRRGDAAGTGRRLVRWWARLSRGRGVALVLLLAAGVLRAIDPGPVESVRLKVFDYWQTLAPRAVTSGNVRIIDIDDESLSSVGQWPWPRTVLAEMIARLGQMGAVVIGFDIVFAEPDRMSPANFARGATQLDGETRKSLQGFASNDAVMAEAMRGARVVLGQTGASRVLEDGEAKPLRPTPAAEIGGDPRPFLKGFAGLVRNLPELEAAAHGRGMFSLIGERDGIVRRVSTVQRVGDALHPTLSIEMLRVATGQKAYAVKSGRDGIRSVVVAGIELPTDENGRMWVYFEPYSRARYISARDVLNGSLDPAQVRGKLLLVGTSAIGLQDIRATPIEAALPGVDVHANLLETILTKQHLKRPADAMGMELVMTLIGGLLILILVPLVGPVWTLIVFVLVSSGIVGTSWFLFTEQRLLLDVTYPAATAFLLYVVLTFLNFRQTAAEKNMVRNAFNQYLSPALVKQVAEDPSLLKLGGETRTMSILFCDVRGFTTISEMFKSDPQGLTRLVNGILTPLTDTILARQGTIDKYMGDCIMAFWNAPLDDNNHARHACESALQMMRDLDGVNDEFRAEAEAAGRDYQELRIGIGINTGDCVVGNMGSRQRFDYSVLGDAVNLAARLEGQSKSYGVDIVVGQDTAPQLGDFALLPLDRIQVKGKLEAVEIFTVVGDRQLAASDEFKRLRQTVREMMRAYRGQHWAAAREHLKAIAQSPLGMADFAALYEERIEQYESEPPPPDWDGVFIATTK